MKLITAGDVAGALMASLPDTGIDMLLGVGGSPEAVLTAAALKCLGGDIQCKLWPRNDVFFSLTGITDGELVRGVHYFPNGATTETLVMRSRSGTVRQH